MKETFLFQQKYFFQKIVLLLKIYNHLRLRRA